MSTFTITATDFKNNFSDTLNRVYYEKKTGLIEKHGKVIIRIIPEASSTKKETPAEAWKRYAGSIPDLPDVRKFRTPDTHRFKLKI